MVLSTCWPRRGSVVVVPPFGQACSNCKRPFTGVLLTAARILNLRSDIRIVGEPYRPAEVPMITRLYPPALWMRGVDRSDAT
jgi:hypothetical protein